MGGAHKDGHRFENIDALRGIAALLVVWAHASELLVTLPGVAARGMLAFDLTDLLGAGRAGVVAFFAISGYVIVPTLAGERPAATRAFVVKRLLRLYPPFWLSMGLAAVAIWWLFDRPLGPGVVLANATMVPIEFGQPQVMGHYWTLEVELLFYGVVLALFQAGRLHHDAVIAWVVIGLSIAWAVLFRSRYGKLIVDRNLVWSFLGYFLSVMFWGALVRARQRRASAPRGWRDLWRADWPFLVVTLLVFGRPLLALVLGSPTVHREDWRGALLGLILFVAAIRTPARYAKPLVWLGTISYSLYLLHPVVLYPIFHALTRHPAWATGTIGEYVLVTVAGSIAIAAASYRLIEAPSNRLARRWVARPAQDVRPGLSGAVETRQSSVDALASHGGPAGEREGEGAFRPRSVSVTGG